MERNQRVTLNERNNVNAEKMCRIIFGDYMQLPPKEHRVPHFGRRLLRADLFEFNENTEH